MKFININKIAFSACLFLALSYSCNDAEYDPIDEAVYFADTSKSVEKKVTVDDNGGIGTASIRALLPVSGDLTVGIKKDEQLLIDYNVKYGTNYVLLPEEQYSLSDLNQLIKQGEVSAPALSVKFKPLTSEMKESGNKYALPLTLQPSKGSALKSGQSLIFVLDKIIITSVPVITKSNHIVINMNPDGYNLPQWTAEMRINIDKLGTAVGQLANQAFFNFPGKIYARFGDAPIPGNLLQIKLNGDQQVNTNTSFVPNKWYHIAFVFNSAKDLKIYINGELDVELPWSNGAMNIGNLLRLGNNVAGSIRMSEVRFWKTARTQGQIKDNMFEISPLTEGLEGYWKLNEGVGYTFNDASGHGFTGVAPGPLDWEHGVRSDD